MTVNTLKAVFVGNLDVGKTSIYNYIINGGIDEDIESDDDDFIATFQINIGKQNVKFDIWDTGGVEKYGILPPLHYKDASLAFLVFDITSEKSFHDLDNFYKDLIQKSPKYIKFIVVGNKADLEDLREVQTKRGDDYAFSTGAEFYIETFARTGYNIRNLFERAAMIPGLHLEKSYNFTTEDENFDQNSSKTEIDSLEEKVLQLEKQLAEEKEQKEELEKQIIKEKKLRDNFEKQIIEQKDELEKQLTKKKRRN